MHSLLMLSLSLILSRYPPLSLLIDQKRETRWHHPCHTNTHKQHTHAGLCTDPCNMQQNINELLGLCLCDPEGACLPLLHITDTCVHTHTPLNPFLVLARKLIWVSGPHKPQHHTHFSFLHLRTGCWGSLGCLPPIPALPCFCQPPPFPNYVSLCVCT